MYAIIENNKVIQRNSKSIEILQEQFPNAIFSSDPNARVGLDYDPETQTFSAPALTNDEIISKLTLAADKYKSRFYPSDTAATMIQSQADKGKPKSIACVEWATSLWQEYYRRCDGLIEDYDFSSIGIMPYTPRECMEE